jgi:hypothetical protein
MGGPLSVARAVTDPRIMRNEPSHRRVHEPSARSDVAPRQAGDTASTVPCPRTAQSDPRGAEARGGAFPGPRPTGASLSDIEAAWEAAAAPKSHVSGFSASFASDCRLANTSRIAISRCLERNGDGSGQPTATRGCSRWWRGEGDQSAAPRNTGITILQPWPSLPRTPPKAAF